MTYFGLMRTPTFATMQMIQLFMLVIKNLHTLIQRLEHDSVLAIEWFEENYMKLNEDVCHLLISGNKYEHIWAKIDNSKIWESQHEKLLGVTINMEIKFNNHISDICLKANSKINCPWMAKYNPSLKY